MYTNKKIIIDVTEEDLIRDGYSIAETAEEAGNGAWYKLSEEQQQFRTEHPEADVTEVLACQLGKYSFDKTKDVYKQRVLEADKAASIFYVNDYPLWLDKETRVGLLSMTIPALREVGETTTTLWAEYETPLSFEVGIDMLESVIKSLDLYSKKVYDKTMSLTAAIEQATTVEELEVIEITGYPEPLKFTLNTEEDDTI